MSNYGYSQRDYQDQQRAKKSRWLAVLSGINLVFILTFAWLLVFLSEDWWLSMVLVYLPKLPFALPAAVLVLWSLMSRSKWLVVNLVSLGVVAGPMMGLVAPLDRLLGNQPHPQPDDLRVVSCNIQGFQPAFPLVVAELQRFSPDLVVFQEVRGDDHPLLAQEFAGWHVVRDNYYWIGSKYPVKMIRTLESKSFDRVAGLLVELELPTGPIQVADIHLMTARRSLSEISIPGMLDGEDQQMIVEHQTFRELEMQDVRAQLDDSSAAQPQILMGDFNTPSSSSLFQGLWSDYQNTFEVAGFGYGYTSPCKQHAHWLNNTPWVRIDHILCSHDWEVISCEVGKENGSDHRMIAATLRLRSYPSIRENSENSEFTDYPASSESVESNASDK